MMMAGFRVEFRAQFRVLFIPWKHFASPDLTPWTYSVLTQEIIALYFSRFSEEMAQNPECLFEQ